MKLANLVSFLWKGLLLCAIVVAVLLLVFQHKLIYFPRVLSLERARERATDEGLELLTATTSEGRQTAYYRAPPEGELERLWLVFSGNAMIALDWTLFCAQHAAPGRGFLLIDHPGYGASEGSPKPRTMLAGGLALLKAFRESHGDPPRLAVLGSSLGGASALAVAAELGIERAVVASCFVDMQRMARQQVGRPLCYLLHHRFDNAASLEALPPDARVTLLHGAADRLIRVEQARELAQRFPTRIDYHELADAGHNGVLDLGSALVEDAVRRP